MDIVSYSIIGILILFLFSFIKVLREYERAVVFTLGRFSKVKGPGLFIIVPFIQQMVRVTLRTIVLDIPSQDVISRDNVTLKVNAVLYFRVIDHSEPLFKWKIIMSQLVNWHRLLYARY